MATEALREQGGWNGTLRSYADQSAALAPGLALALVVALVARFGHSLLPGTIREAVGEVFVAILVGLILSNALTLPKAVSAGIGFALRSVLRLGIVLLGVRLAFDQVVAYGASALILIVILMAIALLVAHGLGRLTNVPTKLATLIGVGTAICGNSAIIATAPVIKAKDEDVSFAVATITLFGTVAVFLYPVIGSALSFTAPFYGTWAGTAVNDTAQAVAAGFALGAEAGDIANVVKLTRNALMGVVIILMGALYARSAAASTTGDTVSVWKRAQQSVPLFVVGYLVMAALNSVGVLGWASGVLGVTLEGSDGVLSVVSRFLILMAIAAVGLGTSVSSMRRTGPKPFVLGLATAAVTSGSSLALITLFGPVGA